MSWEANKKDEIENNLLEQGWNIQNIKSEDLIYASKKFFLFFNRYYVYFIQKNISLPELKARKEQIDAKNIKCNGFWLAAKNISDQIVKYAKNNNIGLMELK